MIPTGGFIVFRGNYVIYGIEPSYFTRQVQCLYRFKDIPHELRLKSGDVREEVEARAGTHLIPVVHTPEDWFLWDSTPITFWMENMHPAVPVIPDDPLQRMAARIVEDFIDEWLIRPALHYRWCYEPDRTERGLAIAKNLTGIPVDGDASEEVEEVRKMIVEWADLACGAMGVTEEHAAQVTSTFEDFVDCVDDLLADQPFLMGPRPGLPDVALAGSVKAHFATDPTPRRLLEERAPSIIDHMQRLWAGEGRNAPWPESGEARVLPDGLRPLLKLIAGDFAEYLTANRRALSEGESTLTLNRGHGPRTIVARLYTERCRVDLADALDALPPPERAPVDDLLEDVGLSEVYRLPPAPDVERTSPRDDRR